MPTRMTTEEAKIEQAIRAARIAKQTLLEETRNSMPLVVEEEEVDVEDGIEEKPTIKVPNQDKEGYGLAGVEEEYKIKKAVDPNEDIALRTQLSTITGLNVNIGLELLEGEKARLTKKQIESISQTLKKVKAMKPAELQTRIALIEGLGLTNVIRVLE